MRKMEKHIYPEKKAPAANVAYRAEFALALVVVSICPPPPRPFKALKRPGLRSALGCSKGKCVDHLPGHIKQTNPSMTTWVIGL